MALDKDTLAEIKAYMDERALAWKSEASIAAQQEARSEVKAADERIAFRNTVLGIGAGVIALSVLGSAYSFTTSAIASATETSLASAETAAAKVADEKTRAFLDNNEHLQTFMRNALALTADAQSAAATAQNQTSDTLEKAKSLLDELEKTEKELKSKAQLLQETLTDAQIRQKEVEDNAVKLVESSARTQDLITDTLAKRRELDSLEATLSKARDLAAELEALGDGIEEIVSNTLNEGTVTDQIVSKATLPKNIVVASYAKCADLTPGIWTELIEARGRMILGANSNSTHGFEARAFGSTGGREEVTLTESQMPSHSHGIKRQTNSNASNDNAFLARGVEPNIPDSSTRLVGGGLPHNNMPPYIALYFCKKD